MHWFFIAGILGWLLYGIFKEQDYVRDIEDIQKRLARIEGLSD